MAAASAAGTASPLTARSQRLERVAHALAQSQEELLRLAIKSSSVFILNAEKNFVIFIFIFS